MSNDDFDDLDDDTELTLQPLGEEPIQLIPADGPSCISCKRPLDPGVRYCTACGRHTFSKEGALGDSLAEHAKNRAEMDENLRLGLVRSGSFGVRALARLFRVFGG